MLDAIGVLRREGPVDAFIVQAPTITRAELDALVKDAEIGVISHDRGQSVASADVALSSSGTATLECAVLGTPVVVMYRLSPMTYRLAKWLVKLPHFSLVNIIAGKRIVPELLQDDVTGEKIAAAVRDVLQNRQSIRLELEKVKAKLGDSGASRRAAEAIMSVARG